MSGGIYDFTSEGDSSVRGSTIPGQSVPSTVTRKPIVKRAQSDVYDFTKDEQPAAVEPPASIGPEPEGVLPTMLRAAVPKIIPGLMGLGGAVGGGALGAFGGPAAPATIPLGAIAGGIAAESQGGKVNKWVASKLFKPEHIDEYNAHLEANAKEHEIAAASGEMLGGTASMLSGSGLASKAIPKLVQAGKIAKEAAAAGKTAAEVREIYKQAAGKARIGGALLESGISGAVMTGGGEARENPDATLWSTTKAAIQGGVTMAPMAFVPHAKSVLGAIGWRAPADAAVLATANTLYDHFVNGKEINPNELKDQIGKDIPSFMLMNGIMSVFGRSPLLPSGIKKLHEAKTPQQVIDDPVAVHDVLNKALDIQVEPDAATDSIADLVPATSSDSTVTSKPTSKNRSEPSQKPVQKYAPEPAAGVLPTSETQPVQARGEPVVPSEKVMGPVVDFDGVRYVDPGEGKPATHDNIIAEANRNGAGILQDNEQFRKFDTSTGRLVDRKQGAEIFGQKEPLHSEDLIRQQENGNAIRERRAAETVPRQGGEGGNLAQGGKGVRSVEQGKEVARVRTETTSEEDLSPVDKILAQPPVAATPPETPSSGAAQGASTRRKLANKESDKGRKSGFEYVSAKEKRDAAEREAGSFEVLAYEHLRKNETDENKAKILAMNDQAETPAATRKPLRKMKTANVPPPPPAERETIIPSEDTNIGQNANGEKIYKRADGSVYRMHYGKPDFGGDLAPITEATGLIGAEESKRLDTITADNTKRLASLSDNQISQLAVDLGMRPMHAKRESILNNAHPDDLAKALDTVSKPSAEATAKAMVSGKIPEPHARRPIAKRTEPRKADAADVDVTKNSFFDLSRKNKTQQTNGVADATRDQQRSRAGWQQVSNQISDELEREVRSYPGGSGHPQNIAGGMGQGNRFTIDRAAMATGTMEKAWREAGRSNFRIVATGSVGGSFANITRRIIFIQSQNGMVSERAVQHELSHAREDAKEPRTVQLLDLVDMKSPAVISMVNRMRDLQPDMYRKNQQDALAQAGGSRAIAKKIMSDTMAGEIVAMHMDGNQNIRGMFKDPQRADELKRDIQSDADKARETTSGTAMYTLPESESKTEQPNLSPRLQQGEYNASNIRDSLETGLHARADWQNDILSVNRRRRESFDSWRKGAFGEVGGGVKGQGVQLSYADGFGMGIRFAKLSELARKNGVELFPATGIPNGAAGMTDGTVILLHPDASRSHAIIHELGHVAEIRNEPEIKRLVDSVNVNSVSFRRGADLARKDPARWNVLSQQAVNQLGMSFEDANNPDFRTKIDGEIVKILSSEHAMNYLSGVDQGDVFGDSANLLRAEALKKILADKSGVARETGRGTAMYSMGEVNEQNKPRTFPESPDEYDRRDVQRVSEAAASRPDGVGVWKSVDRKSIGMPDTEMGFLSSLERAATRALSAVRTSPGEYKNLLSWTRENYSDLYEPALSDHDNASRVLAGLADGVDRPDNLRGVAGVAFQRFRTAMSKQPTQQGDTDESRPTEATVLRGVSEEASRRFGSTIKLEPKQAPTVDGSTWRDVRKNPDAAFSIKEEPAYKSEREFMDDYRDNGFHDAKETPEEFLRRRFCGGKA